MIESDLHSTAQDSPLKCLSSNTKKVIALCFTALLFTAGLMTLDKQQNIQ